MRASGTGRQISPLSSALCEWVFSVSKVARPNCVKMAAPRLLAALRTLFVDCKRSWKVGQYRPGSVLERVFGDFHEQCRDRLWRRGVFHLRILVEKNVEIDCPRPLSFGQHSPRYASVHAARRAGAVRCEFRLPHSKITALQSSPNGFLGLERRRRAARVRKEVSRANNKATANNKWHTLVGIST